MDLFDEPPEFEDPTPTLDLDSLNPEQRAAVEQTEGPLLILAGPGSGKTRVVTHRIVNLLHKGVSHHNILALTFTNKAADEMGRRVRSLYDGGSVWISTFHRFCARLLRQHAGLIGLSENFSILDAKDSRKVIKQVFEASHENEPGYGVEKAESLISDAKNAGLTPEAFAEAQRGRDRFTTSLYAMYQESLRASNVVDFDDLLLYTTELLRDQPELRGMLDEKYRYIMVDEYQDTNTAQYLIVRALSIDHPNLAVTGDPDQSIYGWRGANLSNILDFESDYPGARVVRLEQNYRSTPNILRVADDLIRNNTRRKEKSLRTDLPPGPPVRIRQYPTWIDEATDIADRIALDVREQRRSPSDVAIFYRVHSLSRVIEEALLARGLAYQVLHGSEFYQRKEVKDVLAYLHLINNPSNTPALLRIINTPPRGIGKKTLERLDEHARERRITLLDAAREAGVVEGLIKRAALTVAKFVSLYDRLRESAAAPVEEIVGRVLKDTGYVEHLEEQSTEADNDRVANVRELLSSAREFDMRNLDDAPLERYLEEISLVSDSDETPSDTERVSMMTLHTAKGLEFPCVYIVAMEQGFLPHERSRKDPLQLEEERRLLFVGITRAQEELQLSFAEQRMRHGMNTPTVASDFLMELPRDEMDFVRPMRSQAQRSVEATSPPPVGSVSSLGLKVTTAADMLAGARLASESGAVAEATAVGSYADPEEFEQGMVVSHPEYGTGAIVALSGQGDKRNANVRFFGESRERTFRLKQSPLKPVRSPDA